MEMSTSTQAQWYSTAWKTAPQTVNDERLRVSVASSPVADPAKVDATLPMMSTISQASSTIPTITIPPIVPPNVSSGVGASVGASFGTTSDKTNRETNFLTGSQIESQIGNHGGSRKLVRPGRNDINSRISVHRNNSTSLVGPSRRPLEDNSRDAQRSLSKSREREKEGEREREVQKNRPPNVNNNIGSRSGSGSGSSDRSDEVDLEEAFLGKNSGESLWQSIESDRKKDGLVD